MVQAELGDFDQDEHKDDYLEDFLFAPHHSQVREKFEGSCLGVCAGAFTAFPGPCTAVNVEPPLKIMSCSTIFFSSMEAMSCNHLKPVCRGTHVLLEGFLAG